MKKIACIVKGYPRLSETFIAQEILALEQAGVDVVIYSLRRPTDTTVHPVHKKITARVHYLPEYLYRHPIRVVMGFIHGLFDKRFYRVLPMFMKDWMRDFTPNRFRRFGQALVLAREIEADRQWLYVHFLHTPGSVARYASHLTGLPWSCSAHAKDVWTTPEWEIREKLAELEWLVTCTRANAEYLKGLDNSAVKVSLLYHGLDLSRFPEPGPHSRHDGSDPANPVLILSVGRAVNKKGYDILLSALGRLPAALHWRFVHIGGGPMLEALKAQSKTLGIDERISWRGALSFEQVLMHYQQSDVFVLASRIDADGDRDGLPNVLMEAMTQALPCIATDISGIPELIDSGLTGVLVPPQDPDALAGAIESLIRSPTRRQALGHGGMIKVNNDFALDANIGQLLDRFRE